MLTGATTTVDAPRTVMWTVGQVAERDRVSKQAVSKSVRTLAERNGLTVERNPQGAIVALNIAEYDHLRGRTADPSKAQAERQSAPSHPSIDPRETYDEALRQKTWHEAENRRIHLGVLKGSLVRRDRLGEAVMACGEDIVRILERIPSWSDELATAVAREGTHGLTVALKARTGRLRNEIADALEGLAAASPEVDGDVEPSS